MPSLFVIQGRDQGRRFELREPSLIIGRDSSIRVRLNDTEVSRQHAELSRDEEGYWWQDLESSNGSFVNSVRVDRQRLRSGDRVQIGRTLMIYTDSVPSAPFVSEREVDIVGAAGGAPESRIVHAIRQDENSDLLANDESHLSPWLARARSNLQIMYRTALAVSHTMDIDQLLHRIMELIFEWVDADRGCVMLVDRDSDEWVPKVRRDRKHGGQLETMVISRTILDYVRSRQEGVLTSDARDDDRWEPAASIVNMGVREAICVPMQGRYGVVGVIYIDTFVSPGQDLHQRGPSRRFSNEHLKLMVAIGHQAALAVEDTSYYSAMVQAERLAAMGQTIAGLSHHVKNILQGMRGGSFLIQEGLNSKDWEIARKGWDIVEKNQERISSLVMDMLTFSKEREPERVTADLNEVVGDVLELMEARAAEAGVELVDQRHPDIPPMTFDSEGIHRAILNLVANSIDACCDFENDDSNAAEPSDDPPRVEVSSMLDPRRRRLRVQVRDNGVGISDEQQKRIFNVFVSGKGQQGTGLGLAVSQKILQEHGGQIDVQSKLGQGSCFTLEWPAVEIEGTQSVLSDQDGAAPTDANEPPGDVERSTDC